MHAATTGTRARAAWLDSYGSAARRLQRKWGTTANPSGCRRRRTRRTSGRQTLIFFIGSSREHGEHDGDEQREDHHEPEMTGHFRPFAMSNASSTTSMFRRPAAMMKVLPYCMAYTTSPAPIPAVRATKYGSPTPMSATAIRATSGWLISNGNRRPQPQPEREHQRNRDQEHDSLSGVDRARRVRRPAGTRRARKSDRSWRWFGCGRPGWRAFVVVISPRVTSAFITTRPTRMPERQTGERTRTVRGMPESRRLESHRQDRVGAAATTASRLNSRAGVASIARPVMGRSHAHATPPDTPR